MLHEQGLSLSRIARELGLARRTVTRYVRNPEASLNRPMVPRSPAGRWLAAHADEVLDLRRARRASCAAMQRLLLEMYGIDITARMLQRFCRARETGAGARAAREERR